MIACLPCTPDAFPRPNLCPNSTPPTKFNPQHALQMLENCTNLNQLKQIHAKIIRHGLNTCNQPTLAKLVHLYLSFKNMNYATHLFDQMPNPETFTYNLMIRACTLQNSPLQALLLYQLMVLRDVTPDKFTFPFVIKACAAHSCIVSGKVVKAVAIKLGFYEDIYLQNTLMDLYFKCGDWGCGRKVFDKMRVRNVVTWTSAVAGLVSCGQLGAARSLFEQMPRRNVVSWTAMINGYARSGQPQEAFELFRRMQLGRVRPNEYTLVGLLIASTELGSLQLGRWVHDFVLKNGLRVTEFLGTALIDMYSKCGCLEDAMQVFNAMEVKNVATWNTMITSLGVHGRGEEALELFEEMEMANLQPDVITFVGVLCACVHTNNVGKAVRYFKYMSEYYGITPIDEHYACMIEIYNRVKCQNN